MQARKKVLLVDDDPNNLLMYSWLLQQSGYAVTRAESATEGAWLMEGMHFDVAILDYRMPQVDGLQAARIIRRHRPQMRIIILTRFELPEGDHSPYVDAIVKKGDATDLLTSLARLLDL